MQKIETHNGQSNGDHIFKKPLPVTPASPSPASDVEDNSNDFQDQTLESTESADDENDSVRFVTDYAKAQALVEQGRPLAAATMLQHSLTSLGDNISLTQELNGHRLIIGSYKEYAHQQFTQAAKNRRLKKHHAANRHTSAAKKALRIALHSLKECSLTFNSDCDDLESAVAHAKEALEVAERIDDDTEVWLCLMLITDLLLLSHRSQMAEDFYEDYNKKAGAFKTDWQTYFTSSLAMQFNCSILSNGYDAAVNEETLSTIKEEFYYLYEKDNDCLHHSILCCEVGILFCLKIADTTDLTTYTQYVTWTLKQLSLSIDFSERTKNLAALGGQLLQLLYFAHVAYETITPDLLDELIEYNELLLKHEFRSQYNMTLYHTKLHYLLHQKQNYQTAVHTYKTGMALAEEDDLPKSTASLMKLLDDFVSSTTKNAEAIIDSDIDTAHRQSEDVWQFVESIEQCFNKTKVAAGRCAIKTNLHKKNHVRTKQLCDKIKLLTTKANEPTPEPNNPALSPSPQNTHGLFAHPGHADNLPPCEFTLIPIEEDGSTLNALPPDDREVIGDIAEILSGIGGKVSMVAYDNNPALQPKI